MMHRAHWQSSVRSPSAPTNCSAGSPPGSGGADDCSASPPGSRRAMDASSLRSHLLAGQVIPAHPLALTAERRLDERSQRALTRYYTAAGAGGIAVGVHTT